MRTVGSEILTPVEEADKGLRLKVQRIQQLVSSTLQRRTGLTSASDLMLWRNFIATVPTET